MFTHNQSERNSPNADPVRLPTAARERLSYVQGDAASQVQKWLNLYNLLICILLITVRQHTPLPPFFWFNGSKFSQTCTCLNIGVPENPIK